MTLQAVITTHRLNQTYLASKLNVSRQTFANKMKKGFKNKEELILRDYIVQMGVDCASVEPVSFDETMTNLLKK